LREDEFLVFEDRVQLPRDPFDRPVFEFRRSELYDRLIFAAMRLPPATARAQ
jgi:hypothetical protein